MSVIEIFLIGVSLSMDAFAVSICKGLSMRRLSRKNMMITGLYFGGFQFLMPVIGYFLGSQFADRITRYSHWIAFILLVLIGINMVRESREETEEMDDLFDVRTMIPLAVATSIDALAVGVTFSFMSVRIFPASTLIGCTTFVLSCIGICIGRFFGAKYRSRAELAGGLVLILIGVEILLEGLELLPW